MINGWFPLFCSTTQASNRNECVIILHGLRGNCSSFKKLHLALTDKGYQVICISYPPRKYNIEELAELFVHAEIERIHLTKETKIHFVAHSLGSIICRYYLQEYNCEQLGKVLFLSPPNHGIELIEKFKKFPLFSWFNGPAGMQLGTRTDGFVNNLEKPDYELGILMSDKSVNPVVSAFIPGKDDGRVSLESARLEGMKDFVLVHTNHHIIMKKKESIQNILHFLEFGCFKISECTNSR